MMDLILNMLSVDDHIGKSKNIDIAKGSNRLMMNVRDAWEQRKREKAWQK